MSPGLAVGLVLGLACAVWLVSYMLWTGGLPRPAIPRPPVRIPAQALRRLERRYDDVVHWFTRGAAPCHAQPPTQPFPEVTQ